MKKWKKPKGRFNSKSPESIDRYFDKFYELNKEKIINRITETGFIGEESDYKQFFDRYKRDAINSLEKRKKYDKRHKGEDYTIGDIVNKVTKQETFETREERKAYKDIEAFRQSETYREFRMMSKKRGRFVKVGLENAVDSGTYTLFGRKYTRYTITNEAGTFYVMKAQSPTDETSEYYFYTQEDWDNMFSEQWEEAK